MFDKRSEFKQDFNPLLKYLNIKPVLTSINNPQANYPVEQVHREILNILITKDANYFNRVRNVKKWINYITN